MAKAEETELPIVAPVASSGIMRKFVYLGERTKYGPYRGFTAESVADAQGFTSEDDRKDFLANLKEW